MSDILSGKAVTAALNEELKQRTAALQAKGVTPALAIVRVGQREDDISYEKSILSRCAMAGVAVRRHLFPQSVPQGELEQRLAALNEDAGVNGILLFRPLPEHLDEAALCRLVRPEKDVDGMTDASLTGTFLGRELGFAPCTPAACMKILEHYKIDCAGKRAVVIGRSPVVGKPAAMLLLGKNATVTICHSRSENLAAICREADILIAAAGRARMVTADFVKPGAVVLDVGIHWDEKAGGLCGDVDFAGVEPVAGALTPVPGGVGTVTTSMLVSHVVEAGERAVR